MKSDALKLLKTHSGMAWYDRLISALGFCAKNLYDAGDTQCGMPGKMDGS